MNNSAQTGQSADIPEPTLAAYSPAQLVQIINNGATKYAPSHPQYGQARQIMMAARAELTRQMQVQNHVDSLTAQTPGPMSSGLMGAAEGMSGGLGIPVSQGINAAGSAIGLGPIAGDPQLFAQSARDQFGKQFLGGSAVGGGGLATILAALGVPPSVAMGAPAGLQEGFETGSPGKGAAVGLTTAVGSKLLSPITRALGINALAGKAVGALEKFGGKVAPGVLSKGAAAAAKAAGIQATEEGEVLMGKPVSEIRAALMKQTAKGEIGGLTQAQRVESTIDQLRQQVQQTAAPQVRTQAGGVTTELPTEKMSPIAGTGGKGFEVTGERTTPPVPKEATLLEIQERLGQARASYGKHTAETILPQPAGGATLTAKGAAAEAAPQAPFAAQRAQTAPILELQDKIGRSLTPEEVEKVLQTMPHNQAGAARSAHALSEAAGMSKADATAAARRAAGTYSTFDPRQSF